MAKSCIRLISVLSLCGTCTSQWITGTWTTGYWDCCKPSCSWPNKGSVSAPVRYCHKDTGFPIGNPNEASVCDGGAGGSCADQQPFVVNSGLSMGFAAAAVGGISGLEGDENCGQCYQLEFTDQVHPNGNWGGSHPDLVGKTHIVQVTNIGHDVSGVHSFDLQIPGAGMGIFQSGCPRQYPNFGSDAFDCGNHFGGCNNRDGCRALPFELQRGCEWRYDWYKWLVSEGKTNNPYVRFRRVKCPSQLIAITGSVPTDDDRFPAVNPDDFDPSSRRRSSPPTCSADGADRWGPDQGGCCTGLSECEEDRPDSDPVWCHPSDSRHGSSCWSVVTMCRSTCSISTSAPPTCSVDGADRWGPNLGGCCSGLQQCEEPRPATDPFFCMPNDAQHGTTCWSAVAICRRQCRAAPPPTTTSTTSIPPICTTDGADRWGPNLGGCCSGLQQCEELRPDHDSHFCPPNHPQHGSSCWSSIQICRHRCSSSTTGQPTSTTLATCSSDGADRWGPDLGGCCSGLQQCSEARAESDPWFCAPSSPSHGVSCWSHEDICRAECKAQTGPRRLLSQTLHV